jgi:hypothetical protein
MHKTIRHRARTLVASVAATTLLSVAVCADARAENAHINEMTFNVQSPYPTATINVSSSDGTKWDTIQPGTIGFWAHMKADTRWPGYVNQAGIFLGRMREQSPAVLRRYGSTRLQPHGKHLVLDEQAQQRGAEHLCHTLW